MSLPQPDYAEITRDDPNPLKRWLQSKRLRDAVAMLGRRKPERVVDYGAGDGELAHEIRKRHPASDIISFEPSPQLFAQAEAHIGKLKRLRLVQAATDIHDDWADAIFCLEVFEHLPPEETEAALDQMARILKPGGTLIIGVPVETGAVALFKGWFRSRRRKDDFDADPERIRQAASGDIRFERFRAMITEDMGYYPHHLGFDYRVLLTRLRERFEWQRVWPSPFLLLPPEFNSELTVQLTKPEVKI
jgi:SAM-dependent methyltransferase